MITIEQLYTITDRVNHDDDKYKIASFLLDAINDWPHPVGSVEDYFNQVKQILGVQIINKQDLEMGLQKLTPEKHLWELESMASLIKIFKITETQELGTVIKQLE